MIKVNNIANFEFWVNCFKLHTKKWQKKTLNRLKKEINICETLEENQDKIRALEFLLK